MVVPYRLRPRRPRKRTTTMALLLGLRSRGAYFSLAKRDRFQCRKGSGTHFFSNLESSTCARRSRVELEVGVNSWEPYGSGTEVVVGEGVTAKEENSRI